MGDANETELNGLGVGTSFTDSFFTKTYEVLNDATSSHNNVLPPGLNHVENNPEPLIILQNNSDIEELRNLLNSWDLNTLLEHFIAENITVNILKIMKQHHIDKLFKDFDMGTQIIFEHKLEMWRIPTNVQNHESNVIRSRASSVTSVSSIDSASSCVNNSIENVPNLETILNDSPKGEFLEKKYEKLQRFNDEERTMLINLIASYFDNRQIHLSLSTSYKLEEEITTHFPTEKLHFYRTSKRGKVYIKYTNLKASFQKISKGVKRSTEELENNNRKSLRNFVPETNADECFKSIKYDNLTVEEFDHCWKACSQYRFQDLQKSESTTEFLNKWTEYKKPSGFRLVDMDFSSMFENTNSILTSWNDVQEHIAIFLNENVKEKNVKEILQVIKRTDLIDNSRDAAILWCIHAYLIPTQRNVLKDNTGKKKTTKFSIRDSQESFVYVASTPQELEEHIGFLTENGRRIQPFIMAVGSSITNISEIFVYFDGIKYAMLNFVRAVDIVYKLFHVFNLEYPVPSTNFWTFIQMFFYKMNSKFEGKNQKIHVFIENLK